MWCGAGPLSGAVRVGRAAVFLVLPSAEPWRTLLPRHPDLPSAPGMRAAVRYWDTGQVPDELKWAAWRSAETAAVRLAVYICGTLALCG
jgi:hypothetical protein